MRKKNFKGRCVKRTLGKCSGICRTYDEIQFAYADVLQKNDSIKEFSCNIPLDNSEYMTDFVCVKNDGSVYVCECVNRKLLSKPLTVKLLDLSKEYWINHGIADWRIVINEE